VPALDFMKRHLKKLMLIFMPLLSTILSGQCPERIVIKEQIISVQNDTTITDSLRLKKLLLIKEEEQNCGYTGDSSHAYLLKVIGLAYFGMGNYEQAISYTQKAINIIAADPSKRNIDIISDYYDLSVYYDSLNKYDEKNRAIDSSILIAIRQKFVDASILSLLDTKAHDYLKDGDYERCYEYADWGLTAIKEYPGADSLNYKASFLIYKVNVRIVYEEYDDAARLLVSLEENKRSLSFEYIATCYELSAEVETAKNEYKNALTNYNLAVKYFAQGGNYTGCMQSLNNLGNYLFFQKYHDNQNALACYKKALFYSVKKNMDQNENESFEVTDVYRNIGNLYAYTHFFDSAVTYFQYAFDQIEPGFTENNLLSYPLDSFLQKNKDINYTVALVIDKGNAFLQQYQHTKNKTYLDKAISIYKTADLFLNKIKNEHSELLSKLYWRGDTRNLYEHAIEASYISDNITTAFYFFEQSRAVLLNDQLNKQQRIQRSDIAKQTELEKTIITDEQDLNLANLGTDKYIEIQKRLLLNKFKRDSLENAIKTENPLYYQSFLDSSFITVKDVEQKLLNDHEALMELFTGDSSLYVLWITKNKSYFNKINKADYDSTSTLCMKYIADHNLLNSHFETFKNASFHLYRLLFSNTTITPGRIIISPDEKYFPFEALVTGNSGNTASYFLNDYAVSYTYSARYLLTQFNSNASSASSDFVGYAPVNYPVTTNLPELTGSNTSLLNLKGYFNYADVFTGNKATKNSFLENFQKYKIIQLYTHATDNGANEEPVIFFSDSVLKLSEVLSENLPAAKLIVLSACKTGSGKLYEGEGVFSFNRSFASLGIPAAINNLWSADMDATYKLTELFYKYVSEGLPTDVALQSAKKEYINSTDSKEKVLPYYWASTVLTGKTDTIKFRQKFPWYILLVLPLVSGFVLWKNKKLKNDKKNQ
jgi:CHAT domain-containing protein